MPALDRHLFVFAILAAPFTLASGAQAEPEPVEYVRICDTYGSGYYYIPGTETCLKISGYVRADAYVDGLTEDFKIGTLAFEPSFGSLVIPAVTYDVDVDGEGFGAGLYTRFASPNQKFRAKIEFDYARLSGDGGAMGTLPNLGVPGVGEDFGFAFRDSNEITTYYTDFDARSYVDVKQWGLKLQSHYRLSGYETPDMNALSPHMKLLGGVQYYNTQTDVETQVDLDYYSDLTYVTYKTDLSENTFIPYVGASVGYKTDLSGMDGTQLYVGASAKLGAAFTSYGGYDMLHSEGFVEADQKQQLDESVVTGYLALEGTVALKNGPFKIGLIGNLSYGQFRDPDLYREDSVYVGPEPDDYELVPTRIGADPLLSGRISIRASYQF